MRGGSFTRELAAKMDVWRAQATSVTKLADMVRGAEKNCVIIGDLNLPGIDWERGVATGPRTELLEVAEGAVGLVERKMEGMVETLSVMVVIRAVVALGVVVDLYQLEGLQGFVLRHCVQDIQDLCAGFTFLHVIILYNTI